MASQLRYRRGVVQLISYPTANDGAVAHAIEDGDLCYATGGVAYPAGHLADDGTAAQNRVSFAAAFIGVAMRKTGLQTGETTFKITTDPGYTSIAASGVFAFPCAATSWAPGDMVGAYCADTDTAPADQQVSKVTLTTECIGIAEVPYNGLGASLTEIEFALRPAFMHNQVVSGN